MRQFLPEKSQTKMISLLFQLYIKGLLTVRSKKATMGKRLFAGCSSAWLERLLWEQEVAGSNPVTPIAVILCKVR